MLISGKVVYICLCKQVVHNGIHQKSARNEQGKERIRISEAN
jgi:hypothetical protein